MPAEKWLTSMVIFFCGEKFSCCSKTIWPRMFVRVRCLVPDGLVMVRSEVVGLGEI